jgi:alpha-beta hydrolase superfamily lysophospholipase
LGHNDPVAQFTDEYGISIHYFEWKVDAPRGVVQIAHGLGEHAGRYAELAAALNSAGYSVYADDHRGHGETGIAQYGGDLSRIGHPGTGGLRAIIKGLRQLSAIIRSENPGLPLVFLGHSLGSLMAQKLINVHSNDYDALVLSGTAYRTPGSMFAGDLAKSHRPIDAATGKRGGTGFEWMTRDETEQAKAAADPLIVEASALKLFSIPDGLRLFGVPSRAVRIDLPILIMIGEDDVLGGEKSVTKLAASYREKAGVKDVEVVIFPGDRHEIFNELDRVEVYARLVSWLDSHV